MRHICKLDIVHKFAAVVNATYKQSSVSKIMNRPQWSRKNGLGSRKPVETRAPLKRGNHAKSRLVKEVRMLPKCLKYLIGTRRVCILLSRTGGGSRHRQKIDLGRYIVPARSPELLRDKAGLVDFIFSCPVLLLLDVGRLTYTHLELWDVRLTAEFVR